MRFLRVVEVTPPLFPVSGRKQDRIHAEDALKKFVSEVKGVRRHADIFLLANVKDPTKIRFDTTHAALALEERAGVEVAPVLVTRDQNRAQFLSSAATMLSLGVGGLFLTWGDDLPPSANSSNVRDFPGLDSALEETALIRSRAEARTKLLAPVDVEGLRRPEGVRRAKQRLRAGADFLLAQPPTTDAGDTFDRHASAIRRAGLKGRVLLNAFPFTGRGDIRRYEAAFGWRLPAALHRVASGGADALASEAEEVVRRLRGEGFPGVYLTTRGEPGLAKRLLP